MNTARDIIESSILYGGSCNESGETFLTACSLAYQLTGVGQDEHALTVAKIVRDLGEESYKFSLENDPEALEDVTEGYWGCQ